MEEVGQADEISRTQSCNGRSLGEEEAKKKGKSILQEYFHLKDLNEAVTCVKELNAAEGMNWVSGQT